MCTTSCKKKVRSYDSFGAPIGVTFRGEADYKTICGGTVTLLLIFIMGGSLAFNVFEFLTTNNFKKTER